MGWFFLIGLALSLLSLYLGSRIGFGAVLVGTLFVLVVWAFAKKVKERREDRRTADEIEETGRLLEQFRKESNVLLSKLRGEETVSAKAAEHYKETYDRVLPLLKRYGWRLDAVRSEQRREEGDYSGDHEGIVKSVEKMFEAVRSGIDGQAALQALPKTMLDMWESYYSMLLEKVNSDDVGPQEVKPLFELLTNLSTQLFPLLPDSQVHQLQSRFRDLTDRFENRASSSNALGGFEDDCALLGVDEYYTIDELSAARRAKAAQWHPDKLDNMAPELKAYASQQVARFNGAYERLANRVKWNSEPKINEAEAQDTLATIENVSRDLVKFNEWRQSLGAAINSGRCLGITNELSKIDEMIERNNDSIRRMRGFLTRLHQQAPTMGVTTELERFIPKAIAISRSIRELVQQYKQVDRQVEELQAMELPEDEIEEARLAWRAKAKDALSQNPEALFSDMPVETLKVLQKSSLLTAESLRRLARGTLHDKSLEEAMLKVERLASICTSESLAKATELLSESENECLAALRAVDRTEVVQVSRALR